MGSSYSQGRCAELLIAFGRAILSSFSLLAVWLDPSEPSRLAGTAYAILAAYALYSLVVLLLVFAARAAPRKLAVAAHALDLAIAALVMFFTERSTSPFFAYFVFALAAASLRWGWKAVLATGAVSSISFLVIGTTSTDFAEPNFELNRFIIRGAYLPVITLLLAYVGAHYSKLRRDLARLASWPRILPDDTESVVRSALAQAAAILGAPKIAMVWDVPGEHRQGNRT